MRTRQELANAIRVLSMDAVQQANSGHPGMPMGMADIAEVLWNSFLKHNPQNPGWINRDRFILSNGHGSMLQYALLHLSGYELSLQDLKDFRQLHSKTPGHPEFGMTPGVETTTGPLGQGLSTAVGMAISEQLLANSFNQPKYEIIDHYTYCFVGDGCLMEGISHEACSLAGTLGLKKLIVFWDDNGISIDGEVVNWFNEDVPKRFQSYHWQVIEIDGHDPKAINKAIIAAQAEKERPSLICCKTTIGFGSPNLAGKASCHGAPLGDEEIIAARKKLNWNEPAFTIPEDIYQKWNASETGKQTETKWDEKFSEYTNKFPELAAELQRRLDGKLPEGWLKRITDVVNKAQQENQSIATRKASQQILNQVADMLPELLGGSADLSCSNLTVNSASKTIKGHELTGNYLYYGVREFAMSSIMNGMALYKGFIPYGGTFLTFVDYARNAVRMSALMQQRVIYVLTHDSIGLGEDGPTHQPIEHLSMLRLTPNLSLWRPCDVVETAVAWQMALENNNGPTVLALSRQKVKGQPRTAKQCLDINRGGYILKDSNKNPSLILIATGSEVELAMQARDRLEQDGFNVRVVSMPSVDAFLSQSSTYQQEVLPNNVSKIAIEAGATALWYRFVGSNGSVIGIDRYGESAPGAEIYKALGINLENILSQAKTVLNENK